MKTHNCTICGSESQLEFKYDLWEVRRCITCTHAFSNNIKKNTEVIYDQTYFEKNWFRYPNINLYKKINKCLESNFGNGAHIHDLGCGNGNLLEFFHDLGYNKLSGSDIVSCIGEKLDGKIIFYKSSFEDLKFNESFDFITSIANIEHVNDVHKYAKILHSSLKPGGICAIYTVNEDALIYLVARVIRKLGLLFASRQLYDPHHVNHFNKKSLKSLLTQNKFTVLETQTSNFPLKSTDISTKYFPVRWFILFFIFILNTLSSLTGTQIAQLIFIQKNDC